MNKNNKLLRGATIAELIIVLAVLTIVSAIVISFVTMSNESVRQSEQKVDALNDIAVVENMVDSWLSSQMKYLPPDYSEKNPTKKELYFQISFSGGATNQLSFDKHERKLYSLLENSEVIYQTETITNIETLIKKNSNNELLAICYITYKLELSDGAISESTYSFVVYPYVGIPEVDSEQSN